ncbi:MAG: cytochrome c biogenesis protein CcsA [Acidobacteriota bacterium]|nr:cytochrome c biogenesis protein CcsA [Acidobacteriota bacterium]
MKGISAIDLVLLGLTFIVMFLAIVWALGVAPTEAEQGDVQRIFYFHLGSIWPAFLAFFYVLYASVRYLMTRDMNWDRKALASGEVGLYFASMVLITGPIWAKPTWGVWWAWDARLTSMLVMWFIFLGYVLLREYIDEDSKRARVGSVLGIIGASMVPFVYMSNRWFETQHPKPVIAGGEDSGIKDPQMVWALVLALAAFTLLYFLLARIGAGLFNNEGRIKDLHARMHLLEEER